MSSEMNRHWPLEHPQPDHQSRRSKNAGLTPALLSSHCSNKLPCNSPAGTFLNLISEPLGASSVE
jgi:hypothetical protein